MKVTGRMLLLVSLWLFPWPKEATAQGMRHGVISGVVRDSATAQPLGDAIVFIPGTTRGTAVDSDGAFVLEVPSRGSYVLVASQVGYAAETRQVDMRGPDDTLRLEFRLSPQPAALGTVEVSAGAIRHEPVFIPQVSTPHTYCAYEADTFIPIGMQTTDRLTLLYAFEPAVIDSEKYLHLWLFLFNTSDTVIEFHAERDARLSMRTRDHSYAGVKPEIPPRLRDTVNMTSPEKPLQQKVRATLSLQSLERALAINMMNDFDRKGGGPWLGRNQPEERLGGLNPKFLGDVYSRGTHSGVLRNCRVAANSCVDGSIFFPFPGLHWKSTNGRFDDAFLYEYRIALNTSLEGVDIAFKAY